MKKLRKPVVPLTGMMFGMDGIKSEIFLNRMSEEDSRVNSVASIQYSGKYLSQEQIPVVCGSLWAPFSLEMLPMVKKNNGISTLLLTQVFTSSFKWRDDLVYRDCQFEIRSSDSITRYYQTITVPSSFSPLESVTLQVCVDLQTMYYEELIDIVASIQASSRLSTVSKLAAALDDYTRIVDYKFSYDYDFSADGKKSIVMRKGIVGGLR